jgi:hypothetical protein
MEDVMEGVGDPKLGMVISPETEGGPEALSR